MEFEQKHEKLFYKIATSYVRNSISLVEEFQARKNIKMPLYEFEYTLINRVAYELKIITLASRYLYTPFHRSMFFPQREFFQSPLSLVNPEKTWSGPSVYLSRKPTEEDIFCLTERVLMIERFERKTNQKLEEKRIEWMKSKKIPYTLAVTEGTLISRIITLESDGVKFGM